MRKVKLRIKGTNVVIPIKLPEQIRRKVVNVKTGEIVEAIISWDLEEASVMKNGVMGSMDWDDFLKQYVVHFPERKVKKK